MALVAFWGLLHGQVATTSNTAAVGTMIGLEYSLKTLLAHTHYNRSRLESCFLKEELDNTLIDFKDTGIDALERLARSGHLTSENVRHYTQPLLRDNRLDILNGTSKPSLVVYENINEVIPEIIHKTKGFYDLTLVDINSGLNNPISNQVLKLADLIVVNLNQNVAVLDEFFNNDNIHKEFEDKKIIITLGMYDKESKYKARNIAHKYNFDYPIYTVPYLTDFMDAMNENRVLEFFKSNLHVYKTHDNFYFIQEVRSLARGILEAVGINTSKYIERGAV